MVSDRIQRMKDYLEVDVHPICTEKAEIVLDSWARHEGLPAVLRRAYMTADYLDKRTIFIEPDELIVGNVAAKPHGAEIHTVTPAWPEDDLFNITHGGGLSITDEEHKALRATDKFWFNEDATSKQRSFYEQQGRYYGPEDDDRMWDFIKSGVMCPPWKDRAHGRGFGGAGWALGEAMGLSFFLPDYGKIITEGLDVTLQKAKKALHDLRYTDGEAIHKHDYWQGCILVIEAMERMYYRYGDVAEEEAAKCTDPQRKKELERIADTCHWISKNGARDFKDAMQAFWFYFLMIATGTTGGGRFDQYMYPFYKKSIESGDMTDDDVLEYLEMLRCKLMQFFFVMGGAKQRQKWAGKARWHNFIIGGCDKDGNIYNINADTAAAQIAGKMQAESLIMMTDISGICTDKDNPDTLIPEMDKDVKRLQLIADRFSKIGSLPEPVPVSLNEVMNHVVDYMSRRVSNKVQLVTVFPPDDIIVPLNASLFEWVIENLCKNAVDAMEGEGKITLFTGMEMGRVVVEVADTGKGIKKKDVKNVFRPGFTTKQRGWGLGLSLAKRIVEEYHHGRIYVKSTEAGRGTTFRIELMK